MVTASADAVIGREAELDIVTQFLAAMTVDGPPALMMRGEAGIGKTTIWHAAVQRRPRRSHRHVLSSRLGRSGASVRGARRSVRARIRRRAGSPHHSPATGAGRRLAASRRRNEPAATTSGVHRRVEHADGCGSIRARPSRDRRPSMAGPSLRARIALRDAPTRTLTCRRARREPL